MWGALQKNAQALASIAAEQAQKGIASANQLLEKLDGQLDDEEEEDDNEDDESNRDDPKHAKKVADKEKDSNDPILKEPNVNDTYVPQERNEDMLRHVGDSKINQMSATHYDDHMDKSIDDELDQLLLDDDAIDSENTKNVVAEICDTEKPVPEGHVRKDVVAEKEKTPSGAPRADERPESRPQNQGNSVSPSLTPTNASDQVCSAEYS